MDATKAQRNACKRYYERNKENWKMVLLRLDKRKDSDVIERLESVPNKKAYISELVRGDIDG